MSFIKDLNKRVWISGGYWDRTNIEDYSKKWKRHLSPLDKRVWISGGTWDRTNIYDYTVHKGKRDLSNGG